MLRRWIIIAAMDNWQEYLGAATWLGKQFVKHCCVMQHSEDMAEKKMTRAETGWSIAWEGELWLYFPKSDVVNLT